MEHVHCAIYITRLLQAYYLLSNVFVPTSCGGGGTSLSRPCSHKTYKLDLLLHPTEEGGGVGVGGSKGFIA